MAVAALLALVAWVWLAKPAIPPRLFFNREPISYETQPRKWLQIFGLCLLLLAVAATVPWIAAAWLPAR